MDPLSIAGSGAGVAKKIITVLVKVRQAKLQHGDKLDKVELHLELVKSILINLEPTDASYHMALKLVKDCEKVMDKHIKWSLVSAVVQALDWADSLDVELKPIRETLKLLHMGLSLKHMATKSLASSTPPESSNGSVTVLDTPLLPAPETSSTFNGVLPVAQGSITIYQCVPTTLKLKFRNRPDISIDLFKVKILKQDDHSRSRTLQYENEDETITVTHRFRFGTIPTTDNGNVKDPKAAAIGCPIDTYRATFETNQEINVKHAGAINELLEFHDAEPSYFFEESAHCTDFIARVRHRILVETFRPTEILYYRENDGQMRASLKVCRIWRRQSNQYAKPQVTITYPDQRLKKQVEYSLSDYRLDLLEPKRKKGLWRVELQRVTDRRPGLSLGFQEEQYAKKFLEVYQDCHPDAWRPVLPPLDVESGFGRETGSLFKV